LIKYKLEVVDITWSVCSTSKKTPMYFSTKKQIIDVAHKIYKLSKEETDELKKNGTIDKEIAKNDKLRISIINVLDTPKMEEKVEESVSNKSLLPLPVPEPTIPELSIDDDDDPRNFCGCM